MKRLKSLVAVAVLAGLADNALAVQNIKLGKMDVNPYVGEDIKYDSDIYLRNTNVKDSLINKLTAGVGLLQPLEERLGVQADYHAQYLAYARDPGINNIIEHYLSLGLNYKLPKDMFMAASESLKKTSDQATSELTARAERVENIADLQYEAPLKGPYGYGIEVRHTYHNYLSPSNDALDRSEILLGLGLRYKLQPKTLLFADYQYADLKYRITSANDAYSSNVQAGLAGKIAPKVDGMVKATYQLRNYRNDIANASKNGATLGYGAQLKWTPNEKSNVILFGQRANVESIFGNNRYYRSTLFDLQLVRAVRKISVGIGGGFEAIRYPEPINNLGTMRKDDIWQFRVNMDYDIQKWFKTGLSYNLKNRNSSDGSSSYDDNVIGISVKGQF